MLQNSRKKQVHLETTVTQRTDGQDKINTKTITGLKIKKRKKKYKIKKENYLMK